MKKIILIHIILLIFFPSCKSQNENIEIFEQVCSIIENDFYDSNFNGVNWLDIKKEYRPIAEDCTNSKDLILSLNEMLYKLNSSHCGVGLLSDLKENISPYLFKDGEIGIDTRIIDNKIVVTNVKKNSPADLAEIKRGYIIKKINGLTLDSISLKANYKPPFNKRNEKFHLNTEVLKHLYGEPNTKIKIEFINSNNHSEEITIHRIKRNNGVNISESLPNAYIEAESHFINKHIAYLSFNAFQPNSLELVISKLDQVKGSKGLIIDLRGNDGGSVEAMKLIIGRFISERKKYGTYINRNESNNDFILPILPKYQGEVVLLVDEMSISGAENMAGIFKLFNIGKVVGNHTPGQLLWGNGYLINDSIALAIPTYKLKYSNGYNPESNGIKPDVLIELNREDLLKGNDSQLKFAINYLNKTINEN